MKYRVRRHIFPTAVMLAILSPHLWAENEMLSPRERGRFLRESVFQNNDSSVLRSETGAEPPVSDGREPLQEHEQETPPAVVPVGKTLPAAPANEIVVSERTPAALPSIEATETQHSPSPRPGWVIVGIVLFGIAVGAGAFLRRRPGRRR